LYNIDKDLSRCLQPGTTPGGQRYPGAHQAIVDQVQRGTLLMTYIGHGFELVGHMSVLLEIGDINGWTNLDHMPAFLTATCEFTRVDDPGRTSAGELVFLNPNGAGICLFTLFSSCILELQLQLMSEIFQRLYSIIVVVNFQLRRSIRTNKG
jgi:hypothetical protein